MKHLKRLWILLYILLTILITFGLALLCYATMYGMDWFLELTRTWETGNGFVNFLIYVFQFIVSGFKYTLTLLAVYGIIRLYIMYFDRSYGIKRKYILGLLIVFQVFSLILVIIGPDYKVLFNPAMLEGNSQNFGGYLTAAFSNSMLLNYFRAFNSFLETDVFKENIIILQDVIVISLYYMGAIIKPVKMLMKKKNMSSMLLTPFFYSFVFVVQAIFVVATKKTFNPWWLLFLYLTPLLIVTVFDYIYMFKYENFYIQIPFYVYLLQVIIFFILTTVLTFRNQMDYHYILAFAICIIVPQIPAFFFRFEFASLAIAGTATLIGACFSIGNFINIHWAFYFIPFVLITFMFFMASFIAEKNYESESNLVIIILSIIICISVLVTSIVSSAVGLSSPLVLIPSILLIGCEVPLIIYNKKQML